MKNSKIVKILKTFSKEELKEFEKFTASPYFARGRNLVLFLNEIKKFYPSFTHEKFTNECIFNKLFPGKKFESKSSNNLIKTLSYELLKMCEEFLIQTDFKSDINSRNYYLLNKYREKKLYTEYEKKYEDAISYQEKNDGGDASDFLNKYFLLHTYNEYCVEKRKYKEVFETIAALDETSSVISLIRAYRGFEFKHLAPTGYNLESVYSFTYDLIKNLDSEKLLREMKARNNKYYPYIAINYMFYLISEYSSVDKYYFEFKKLIYENLNLFGHTERYILFCRLASYCVGKRNDERFVNEEFEIYKKALMLGVYKWSKEDDFSILHFKNIVSAAISVKELDWLEDFIEKYSNELASADRESMKHYSYANLNFERMSYEKALENILKIKFDFIYYKLDIKILMFKIYYDMNYTEQAFSMLEVIRQYISTAKELSETRRSNTKNFIKNSKELLKLKLLYSDGNHELFKREIMIGKFIGSKGWISDKIKELKKLAEPKND
ncbi:MAG: hypothetical protein ABI840_07315 [bacterium]